ncbi:MAG: toprim domain-containing protein [Minisyncoccia bacterium]
MDTINKLTKIFSDFPGIGPRQAKRFVYYLLVRDQTYLKQLVNLLSELKDEIVNCEECHRFFPANKNNTISLCDICRGANRDVSEIMIVSRDIDLENMEKTHSWNGRYFVLGGNIPILEKNPEQKVRINELLSMVEKLAKNGLGEIVLGLSANSEGEYTEQILKQTLAPLAEKYKLSITTLGRGLSTGTEIEYSDGDTLKSALENRHKI